MNSEPRRRSYIGETASRMPAALVACLLTFTAAVYGAEGETQSTQKGEATYDAQQTSEKQHSSQSERDEGASSSSDKDSSKHIRRGDEPDRPHHARSRDEGRYEQEFARDQRPMTRPYSNYDEWRARNPRFSHPIHDMVHGRTWEERFNRDRRGPSGYDRAYVDGPDNRQPRDREYADGPRDRNWAPRDPFGYQERTYFGYPRNRIIWYNDRYYDGRYYEDDDSRRGQARFEGRTERPRDPAYQQDRRRGDPGRQGWEDPRGYEGSPEFEARHDRDREGVEPYWRDDDRPRRTWDRKSKAEHDARGLESGSDQTKREGKSTEQSSSDSEEGSSSSEPDSRSSPIDN